jgi:protein TonB
MTANGFLQQKPAKTTSLGLVALLHVGVIGGVLLIKGPQWIREQAGPMEVDLIPVDQPPPPPEPPKPIERQVVEPQLRSRLDVPPQVIPTPVPSLPSTPTSPIPSGLTDGPATTPPSGAGEREVAVNIPPQRPIPPPTRVEARFDPRAELQPPYPASEQRAEREGEVRLRVTIGANGRVIAATRLSATTEAFWRATERQALSRWRFKPATLGGQPVESSKTLTVHFQLDGQ